MKAYLIAGVLVLSSWFAVDHVSAANQPPQCVGTNRNEIMQIAADTQEAAMSHQWFLDHPEYEQQNPNTYDGSPEWNKFWKADHERAAALLLQLGSVCLF